MYKTTEEALKEALKNEQARMETMKAVDVIRANGGEAMILRLAGAILSATPLTFGQRTTA